MGRILAAHGLKKGKDYKAVYANFTDLATQVGDGTLDAASSLETIPAAYRMGEERGVKALKMDPAALDNVARWHMGHGRWNEAAALLEKELATGRPLPGAREALDHCMRALTDAQNGAGR